MREIVDPIDQTTDLANAVSWVCGEPQCDPARIGLWGSSYSGGHVVYVAARDPRVKATVSQVPALDSRPMVLAGTEQEKTFAEASARAHGELGYPPPGARVIGNLRGAPLREKMMQYRAGRGGCPRPSLCDAVCAGRKRRAIRQQGPWAESSRTRRWGRKS